MENITMTKIKIKNLIKMGKFANAEKELIVSKINEELLKQIILDIAFDEKDICAYAFLCFLITKNEAVIYHQLASKIMEIEFCYLDGAYQVALYHLRRILELDPDNIEYKEMIFHFNKIPDVIIEDNEVKKVAYDILEKDPTNEHALSFLENIEK